MKKTLSFVLSVVMLMSLFAGFSVISAAAEEAPSGELNYVTFWNEGEPATNYLKECVAAFEAETGVKVKLTPVGRDLLNTIKSDILMKNPPDLIDQDFSELNAALMQGSEILVMPVNDLLEEAGPDGEAKFSDIFPTGDLDLFARDGNIYFVPYVKVTSGFFYDKTMFANFNLTAPKTWDEFIAVNQTLKDNGIAPLALDGNISFYNAYYYYWACARVLGSGKFSEAAFDKTGAAWDDPGFLKAAELVYELSKGGKDFFIDGYEGSAYPAAQSDWALGDAGSVLCGTWIPVETSPQVAPDWEYGFYPFPTVEGGAGSIGDVESYLMGYAIPKDAKNPVAAKAFIKFALKKLWAERYVELSDNMSGRKDVAPPAVLADTTEVLSAATESHKSYDGLMSDLPEWWANVFYPLDNELVFGTMEPATFISEIKAKTIEYWAGK